MVRNMDFGFHDSRRYRGNEYQEEHPARETHLPTVNLAPLKGILESDPVRSKVLKLLVEDAGWITTADLLNKARELRPILGAVTIGTLLNDLSELVATRLVRSSTCLSSGPEWAEWRIYPDWLMPIRKLLQMLTVRRVRNVTREK